LIARSAPARPRAECGSQTEIGIIYNGKGWQEGKS